MTDTPTTAEHNNPDRALCAYLLGTVQFDAFLTLQRRLVYDISGDRDGAALLICDHPPGITIGREGSCADVRPGPDELHARGWPVRWVSRGGGTMLHLPGQVACYPVFPLDAAGITVARYLEELQKVVIELLRDYQIVGITNPCHPGIRVNERRIAHIGVAVRYGVTGYGLVINTDPDLGPFRDVHCGGDTVPMTSIQRETAGRFRVQGVRQRLVELVAERFGFNRVSVFHTHPGALPQPTRHAAAQRS